jgi:hypothetical protein
MDITELRLDPRRREAHPERIVIGDEVFIRNDIQAKQLGTSERSVNRDDKHGAPYRFFGGVKYRPEKAYAEFILSSIETDKPPLQRHKQYTYKDRRKRRT